MSMDRQSLIEFFAQMGVPNEWVNQNFERARGDPSVLMDLWESRAASSTGRPGNNPPNPNTNNQQLAIRPDVLDTALQNIGKPQPPLTEEEQLKQALELSKQVTHGHGNTQTAAGGVDEDKSLQEAIAASLQTQKMDIDPTGASSDEMAMQKALEASILEAGGDPMAMTTISNNPNHRKREDGVPVGLKNVGNTCYFNSLLQTYFYIPDIRRAVLSFPSDRLLAEKTTKTSTVEFMRELQRLFAYLILSNQKWVDPSALLKKLLDKSGQPVNIGNQEDVSEFNELFLTRIAEGLALTSELTKSKNTSDIIKEMFQGSLVEFINSFELDGSPVESSQDVPVGHLILPVTEEPQDLHMCIESSMVASLAEYATPKGHKTVAEQTRWFKRLPPILMMQQNRVQFDQNTGTYRKLTTALYFEKEITMDRYFLESRERTTQTRKIVNQWRSELGKRQKEINSIRKYKGRDHGLDQALESTIDYLKEKMGLSAEDAKHLLPTVEVLSKYYAAETERLKGLETESKDYQAKIDGAYADYPKNSAFSLFAVWVHAGVAGSGHYWAYMRCGKRVTVPKPEETKEPGIKTEETAATTAISSGEPAKGKEKVEGAPQDKVEEQGDKEWLKFNDLKISDTNEFEVMNQAVGGHAMSTAYFLIYMDSKFFAKLQECPLPIDVDESKLVTSEVILKEIQEDNTKYLETLEKYNKSQNEDKVTRFFNSFENQQASARSAVEEGEATAWERDARIRSKYAFLHAIGAMDSLQYEIILREYAYIFSRGLETDLDTSIYTKVQEKLGKELVGAALQYKLEDVVAKTLDTEYKIFRHVAQYYNAGLNFFVEQKFDNAFASWQHALELDRSLAYPSVRRRSQIEATVLLCIQILFIEAERRCSPAEWQEAMDLFRCAAKASLCVLSHFSPSAHSSNRDKLTLLFNTHAAPMPLEAYQQLTRVIAVLHIPAGTEEARMQIGSAPRLADIGNDDEKWATVSRNMTDKLDSLKVRYPELWHRFMPQPPPKEKPSGGDVSMPDLVQG